MTGSEIKKECNERRLLPPKGQYTRDQMVVLLRMNDSATDV